MQGRLRGRTRASRPSSSTSRRAGPGALFVAMRGERRDGHDFVTDALSRGAVAALVHREVAGGAGRRRRRPGARATGAGRGRARRMPGATVIGITGANGKTSTKDLAAAILSDGVPDTREPGVVQQRGRAPPHAARSAGGDRGDLAEMGARREGDVALLCRVARPDDRGRDERRRRAHGGLRLVGGDRARGRRAGRGAEADGGDPERGRHRRARAGGADARPASSRSGGRRTPTCAPRTWCSTTRGGRAST